MRFIHPITLALFVLLAALSPASLLAATTVPAEEAGKLLPNKLGDFKATSPAVPFEDPSADKIQPFGVLSAAIRSYQSKDGEMVSVALVVTRSASSAYALLTNMGCQGGQSDQNAILTELGTKRCSFPAKILFARGPIYIAVEFKKGDSLRPEALKSFARVLAPTLDKGDDDVPVLVKHLPDWHSLERQVLYVVNQNTLKNVFSNQGVVDVLSFEGGAEAVVASYGAQKLLVVEFNTPQSATENDHRITARIQELRNQGQPVPTAYRRVGNYSVFVFDAPSELAANQLIDQVKYQQVVQWLGKNPYAYREAVAEFTQTTLGVLVSVVKASGLVLLGSLAIGGFFGALLFTRRRAQQQVNEAYSDAGGMLRLNLDEVKSKTDPARLLSPGK